MSTGLVVLESADSDLELQEVESSHHAESVLGEDDAGSYVWAAVTYEAEAL